MESDTKRQFLLRWATIASGSAALPGLTDSEIAAVAGGIVAVPLYGVHVEPLYGVRVPPHKPPRIVAEYGPLFPVTGGGSFT